jgi:hypothetical protein
MSSAEKNKCLSMPEENVQALYDYAQELYAELFRQQEEEGNVFIDHDGSRIICIPCITRRE